MARHARHACHAHLVKATEPSIARAADLLRAGQPVAFPTETVYGLGADTFNEAALDRVFELKGRPMDNPLIAHVLGPAGARRVAVGWDDRCERLARRCWPGPLTIVLGRARSVPPRATAGWPSIAVRAPAHPVARALLEAFGGPVSAPSANKSGGVSPTTAAHVVADFADAGDLLVLDGGACEVGIESTVVDLTTDVARVLRPGSVTVRQLGELLGEAVEAVEVVDVGMGRAATQGLSPGTSMRHYAPRTATELVDEQALPGRLAELGEPVAVLCFDDAPVAPPHRAIVMPRTAQAYAARLYAALREADEVPGAMILVVRPPSQEGLWSAVVDRLGRATHHRAR